MEKKKLFISCPMKGRTEEDIRSSREKMHKIAEIVFDQELEVIESYIEDNPPKDAKQAVWFLGKSIQLLSEADYFIGVDWTDFFHGCNNEKRIAIDYGIPWTVVDIGTMMPDALAVENAAYEAAKNECTRGAR